MTDREKQRLRKRQLPESMLKLVKTDNYITPSLYGGIGEMSMSYADNPVMDAEYMAEIRSRTILRKRARIAYEEAEREGNKYGRTENNCIATVGKYPV